MIQSIQKEVYKSVDEASNLEWMARNLAKGLNLGKHHSKKLGVGLEFNQFRNYVQGDDVRLLDWKMYAKTGQYFIRQSDVQLNTGLHVSIDTSKSMDYMEEGRSKIDVGKILTATLTYVIAKQSDEFSWTAGDNHFVPSNGLKNWRRSIISLEKVSTDYDLSAHYTLSKKPGIHLWITDLYMDVGEVEKHISINSAANKELIIFHVVGKREEELDFDSNTKFVDLETGEEMQVNAKKFAEEYKTSLDHHIHEIKKVCQNRGVVYRKIYLDAEIRDSLRLFLSDYNALSS